MFKKTIGKTILNAFVEAEHTSTRWNTLDWIVLPFILVSIALTFSSVWADNDLWGHVKWGLDALNSGQLLLRNPSYSYMTGNNLWISTEWLFGLVTGACYKLANNGGLYLLFILLIELIFVVLYSFLKQAGIKTFDTAFLVVLAFFMSTPYFSDLRAQLFTFLFFLIECCILTHSERTNSKKWLLLLPLIFVFWINLHGGVLAGIGLLFTWLIVRCVSKEYPGGIKQLGRENFVWIISLLGCALVCFINPYGAQLPLLLLNPHTLSRPEMTEWQPLPLTGLQGWLYVLFLLIVWGATVYGRETISLSQLVTIVVCSISPLIALRHVPLFLLGTLSISSEAIGVTFKKLADCKLDRRILRPLRICITIGLIIMVPYIRLIILEGYKYIGHVIYNNTETNEIPMQAVNILENSGTHGNLAVYFDWGNYCVWHLQPKWKVSIDSRREDAYSRVAYDTNVRFADGLDNNWDDLLTKYPTDAVLCSKNRAVFNLMRLEPGWKLVSEDKISGLFAKKNSSMLTKLLEAKSKLPFLPPQPYNFP